MAHLKIILAACRWHHQSSLLLLLLPLLLLLWLFAACCQLFRVSSLVFVVAIVAVAADVAVAAVVVVSVVCLFVWLLACSGQCVGNEVSSAHWCHPFPRAWGDQPWRKWTDRALAEKHHATCGFHPASRHPFTGPQPFSRIALSCTLVLTASIAECYRLLSFALLLLFFMSLSCCLLPCLLLPLPCI